MRQRHAGPLPLLAALALLAGSCSKKPDQSMLPPANRVATSYAAALRVDLSQMERRRDGLYVQDVTVGDGARADSGDVVTVEYAGWLPPGKQVDATEEGKPFKVAIGYGRVIKGWDQGIVGMRVGGERRLVVPPALGYGSFGKGSVPGGATLVFDVKLVDVENRTPEKSR